MGRRLEGRWLLTSLGVLAVAYCLAVLTLVAVAPDLRLRFLLVDDEATAALRAGKAPSGVQIRRVIAARSHGPSPAEGDTLLRIGDVPIQSFSDVVHTQLDLSRQPVGPGARIPPGGNPLAHDLPAIVQEDGGPRWVEIQFRSQKSGMIEECRLAIQSLPLSESLPTFLWFALELAIFGVGWFAYWHRPYDPPARLFFTMCVVTLGAFVAGFHWWLISGSLLLAAPFIVCSVLVPVVTLHFFLVYPRPKFPLSAWPGGTVASLYFVPVTAMVLLLVAQTAVWLTTSEPVSDDRARVIVGWLAALRTGIYVYLGIAALYFVATLVALVHSVMTTRNPLERSQVAWILWAGLVATGFIGYTLMLAYFSRVQFAMGGARLPMFLASLLFMVAYAVGILRYKLMRADDLIRRGPLYYVMTWGATAALACGVVWGGVLAGRWVELQAGAQPQLFAAVLTVLVVFFLAGRDVWQRWVERRFVRDKYRLDKALQRMNRAVGQLADVDSLSERLLSSCRDMLQADWAALYLREQGDGEFRLAAIEGDVNTLPLNWVPTPLALDRIASEGTWQRSLHDVPRRDDMPESPGPLKAAELAHVLEIDGETAGVVVLGPKQVGAVYSPEDASFLAALAEITSVALHCARVHQDLTQLNEDLRLKVQRIAQQKQQISLLQAELAASRSADAVADDAGFQATAIKGSSPQLLRVLTMARKVAASSSSVLIRGESGTGKELMARAIHENSPRRSGPLISVHCGALAPGVLESELFGHVRGSFTGATGDKRGRFELAQGGTIFLDEIGDISLETQIKLLRVLQERSFEPVGGTTTVEVDVRVIAATHRNLEQLISSGQFREDLYYRLNVVSLTLPSLRDRKEDLHELAVFFLQRAATKADKRVIDFEDAALQALLDYDWPGNIRELENVIERAVVLAEGEIVALGELPADLQQPVRPAASNLPVALAKSNSSHRAAGTDWRELPEAEERRLLLDALQRTQGNKARAARLLGLPRSTFFSKLKKYGLFPETPPSRPIRPR